MKAENIIKLRNKLKLTQEKFAALLGVTRLTVVYWEKDERVPSPLALEKLLAQQKKFN